jgi:hypothetical protein
MILPVIDAKYRVYCQEKKTIVLLFYTQKIYINKKYPISISYSCLVRLLLGCLFTIFKIELNVKYSLNNSMLFGVKKTMPCYYS